MTDTSDCESDAGASPSVSSDESGGSSASNSSSPALKIVCETPSLSTPRKRVISTGGSSSTVDSSLSISVASSSVCSTPVSTGRKPRRKQINQDSSFSSIISTPVSSKTITSPRGTQSEPNKVTSSNRKRKQATQSYTSVENDCQSDPKLSPDSKRKRNKRRRTRSERNIRAGKAVITENKTPIVAEGEEAVALDAEIDRVLEEKAIKNNLSATNVKSIIRHVITNNMVQKMIMSAMRKKAEATDGNGGGSSDEDGLLEPKMTRAKIKELMENKQTPLWPIVDSPVKLKKKPVSETHMLIHQHDLPEDSSGDEEYVPKETDIAHYSDDESSGVASHASDTPSPAVTNRVTTRRSLQADKSSFFDSLFKTPPPRPNKSLKSQEESAISRRTRSKHPLNDTPLEDLERRLVPPDITEDMYDFVDTDNEDYLTFLKDFLFPNKVNEMGDDEEGDPEYNVMEDDEDVHDKEELRRDRAVKVPKKELNELVAELIEEYHVSSGDDLEDHDFTSLTSLTPFMNDSGIYSDDRSIGVERGATSTIALPNMNIDPTCVTSGPLTLNADGSLSTGTTGMDTLDAGNCVLLKSNPCAESDQTCLVTNTSIINSGSAASGTSNEMEEASSSSATIPPPPQSVVKLDVAIPVQLAPKPVQLFRELDLQFLQHQIRQHVQLVAQSYVLTISSEDECLKHIAKTSKSMIIELRNFAKSNGPRSNFAVCNLEHAWNLVNLWPYKYLLQSPIKKKILEEKYINDSGIDDANGNKISHFPRHVVKIIAENVTFVYNHLLPDSYNQKNTESRCKFSYSEDALIVRSLEEMKGLKRSAANMAEIISEILLVVYSPCQVYHRIRNLRKLSQYCHPDIKRYFTEGILPEPDRAIIKVPELLPLLRRSREGLSTHWSILLDRVEDSPSYKWEEQLSKDPILKSVSMRWAKAKYRKKRKSGQSSDEAPSSPLEILDQVFPNGISQIEKPDPSVEAIPLLTASGKPGAIIYIPKYAMLPPVPPQSRTPSKICVVDPQFQCVAESSTNSQQTADSVDTVSNTNLCVVGLNHLIRKSRETPKKAFPVGVSVSDLPSLPVRSTGMHVDVPTFQVHCVGKPFELPKLSSSTAGNSEIINLATLQTPLKREVFQKVAEQNDSTVCSYIENETVSQRNSLIRACSPNVVDEGTEVHLTSDEDDAFEGEPNSSEPPVVVKLSDEDEMMVSPVDAGGDGKGTKGDSSPKKTDGGSSSNKQGSASSNNSSGNAASSSRKLPVRSGGNKGEDSDDDHEKRPYRKRSLPKDCSTTDKCSKEEEHASSIEKDKPVGHQPTHHKRQSSNCPTNNTVSSSQMQPPPSKPIASTSQYHTSRSQPKKARTSPRSQTSRRVSKYNVTPADKMLQENSTDFDDVADAYMETYLAKVHSVTESKNPGLYTAFLQTLMDAGDLPVNQAELHAKVKVLFKDYPELLKEFESFLDPTPKIDEPNTAMGPTAHDQSISHIKFLQQLEKFTEKCPQLKSKIMNKLKSLRESPQLSEKDIVVALEPFLAGNPVMMDAFKSLFPSVYRPQSVSSSVDFEEIELDLEEPPRDNSNCDSLHFETVKLPDETSVSATSTCPCCCHTTTSDPACKSRSKHCPKCSLKFQDGKVLVHNGRVMRPVSVELTPVASKTTPQNSVITVGRPCNALHHDRVTTQPQPQAHSSKSKEFKEPEVSVKNPACNERKSLHHPQPHHAPSQFCSVIKSTVTSKQTVEENLDKEHKAKADEVAKPADSGGETLKSHKPQHHHPHPSVKSHRKPEIREWTDEEDTIILSTCQQEPSLHVAWQKMAELIPHRPLDLIKNRCSELIALIQKVSE
ncbi:unnamed protein product [Orchesella dallaii]|uniref:GON-4-like protein n=1 Tax=Orchesella dallaii TaxID=48710 RepID=A0ABP1REZ9_9HEXA